MNMGGREEPIELYTEAKCQGQPWEDSYIALLIAPPEEQQAEISLWLAYMDEWAKAANPQEVRALLQRMYPGLPYEQVSNRAKAALILFVDLYDPFLEAIEKAVIFAKNHGDQQRSVALTKLSVKLRKSIEGYRSTHPKRRH